MSIVFDWDIEDFNNLVTASETDEAVQYARNLFEVSWTKPIKILEAGCGLGRVVQYLYNLGFDIEGIEINSQVVADTIYRHPNLRIRQGNIEHLPYLDQEFEGIICLGVVEHFLHGPVPALKELRRACCRDGEMILTVPCYNNLRQTKYPLKDGEKYYKCCPGGNFFEYWYSKEQIVEYCIEAGWIVRNVIPVSYMDGVYHEKLAPVRFEDWKFYPTKEAELINKTLKQQDPWFHNHMVLLELQG
ncbi:MAG: class I SAM-dependent methyltransferase [Thaumarchaeota archaeon]|nr:class I SAM-dependent methyltransferase [Nitrososphaerota archaeon]